MYKAGEDRRGNFAAEERATMKLDILVGYQVQKPILCGKNTVSVISKWWSFYYGLIEFLLLFGSIFFFMLAIIFMGHIR